MPIIGRDTGGADFDPTPEGIYVGVCYAIYDIGHQYNKKYDKYQQKVIIAWELPEERINLKEDGKEVSKPRAVSSRYGLSLGSKAYLRQDLESWRGKKFTEAELEGFDLRKILGKACQVQIIHDKDGDKTYANVQNVMPLPKGTKAPKPENPLIYYCIEDDGFSFPETMPEWVQKVVKKSREYGGQAQPQPTQQAPMEAADDDFGDFGDGSDIPF